MIHRFAGLTPTRSRAVVHDDLVFTVAVAPDPVSSSMYEQSAKALARIDESLTLCGTDKRQFLAAIVLVLDALDDLPLHQRRDRAADGGFMGAGALSDILRAAGIVAEAERRQHAPFRNVEPVAGRIFDRERRTDFGGQPVQAERHESEQVQPGTSLGRAFFALAGGHFA